LSLDDAILIRTSNTLKFVDNQVLILDRRRFPEQEVWQKYSTYEEVAEAIEDMVIQGAGSVAFAACFGLALAAHSFANHSARKFSDNLCTAAARLKATRPTGEYLVPLVEKMALMALDVRSQGLDPVQAIVRDIERRMAEDDALTKKCGIYAADLISDGDGVLTHCYPGGALLYMLDHAQRQGKHVKVYCSETRPYLQGARLTAASVSKMGFPATVITDNMGAFLMWQGKIQKFVTACDRISMDGHIANKVGTYQYAICANYHRIPFIVLGYDGPQTNTPGAEEMEIEERNPEEVLYCRGVRTGAPGVQGYYPAFDITPPTLIGAIVTDRGVFSPLEIGKAYEDRFPAKG
jgi:methylthioribose-1-phosphate isomerase